jgi:hypothetical protein
MYTVLTARAVVHAQRDDEQNALNVAAEYVKGTPDGVAVVLADGSDEAVAVIFDKWVYVAPEPAEKVSVS